MELYDPTSTSIRAFILFQLCLLYIKANGDCLIWGWKDNKAQGYGEYYYSNGDVYKGNWVSGSKEGQGTMTYKDGTVQSGLWKRGKFQG